MDYARRAAAEVEQDLDLRKTPENLLTDIHDESLDHRRDGSETVSRTMARFASLLAVLSRQTKEESDRNLQMQQDVVTLTRRLLWLTFFLAVLTLLMFAQQIIAYAFSDEHVEGKARSEQQETNDKI